MTVSSPTPTPTPAPTPTPPLGFPPYPTLVDPPDAAVLETYPRVVTLRWAPVEDPTGVRFYRVELDLGYSTSPEWDRLSVDSGYYGNCGGELNITWCTTANFPGAQPGRWRVIVANGNGNETASVWRTFRFTR